MGAKVWKRTVQGGSQSYTVGVHQQQSNSSSSNQHPQAKATNRPHNPPHATHPDSYPYCPYPYPCSYPCPASGQKNEGNFERQDRNQSENNQQNYSSSSSTTNDAVSAQKTDDQFQRNFNLKSSVDDFNFYQKNSFQSNNNKFCFAGNGSYNMGKRGINNSSDQFQFQNQQDNSHVQFKSTLNGAKPPAPPHFRHSMHKKNHKFNTHAQQHFKQKNFQKQQQQQPQNPEIFEQQQKYQGAKEEVVKIQERLKQLEDEIRQTKKRKAEKELNEHEEKKQRLRNKLQRSFAKEFEQVAEEGQVKREAEERERQRQEIIQLIQKIQKASDPYEILGVDKSVLDLEAKIRTSFKKLAVTLHPDKCSFQDSTEAFRKVRSAYDTLQGKLVS